jgi:hypothetical protein
MLEEIKKEDHGKSLMSWKIPEYTKHERGRNWFILAGIILFLFLIYAFYTRNFLFVVILILSTVIILMRSKEEPMELDFNIFEDGMSVGRKFYSWRDVNKFYIIYDPPEVKNLYFELKGFRSRLSIPLLVQNPIKVREVLLKYLIEDLEQEQEPLSEEYDRWLKI